MMTEIGQSGAGGRAMYDPNSGAAPLDWSGKAS